MRNHWKVLKSDVMIMLLGKEQLVGAFEREASDDGSRVGQEALTIIQLKDDGGLDLR